MSGVTKFRRRWAAIGREGGFTLIELLVVIILVGITSAMFADTFSAVVNRSSVVQDQNILQTEVRAALNQLVSDIRDASYGDTTVPIITFGANSLSFYSPDRLQPFHMRRITYSMVQVKTNDWALKRQVTTSSNTNGPPWTGISTDTGVTSTLFDSVQNPTSIFQYCTQTPRDMAISPTNPTSPQLITWQCTAPTTAANVKTVVIQIGISSNPSSQTYYYGAVATLRWNAS